MKLFGDGLIPVTAPILVKRYNACLCEIGVTPTALTEFRIDGIGWSPEIAAEKHDDYYLSIGPSNPFGIILTPEQYRKPVYYPSYSFDRNMLRSFFKTNRDAISDITSQTAVWLDIDDGISDYTHLTDLLNVNNIKIRPHVLGNLMKVAIEENRLAEEFMQGANWSNLDLRAKLVVRGKAYGDLRKRNVIIHDMEYEDIRTYYTRAFGGTFVFRDLPVRNYFIVMTDKDEYEKKKDSIPEVYFIEDKDLPGVIEEEDLAEINWDRYRKDPKLLAYKMNCAFANAVLISDEDEDFFSWRPAKILQTIASAKAEKKLPEEFGYLENFARSVNEETGICPYLGPVGYDTRRVLLLPKTEIRTAYLEAVEHLLAKIAPFDPLGIYTYDTNEFKKRYETWPLSKKNFAGKIIQQDFIPFKHHLKTQDSTQCIQK